MTKEELKEVLGGQPADVVKALQVSSYTLPKWADLVKQYDPMKHEIITNLVTYPLKLNENSVDEFKRTALGLQKLAVKRISQAMFSTPVKRSYSYDRGVESQQKIVDIIEQVYRTDNSIDRENIERAKVVNASCQMATVWSTYESENVVEGEKTKYKLTHRTYSEMEGYKLFPQTDPNGELLVIAILYTDSAKTEYMIVYANGDKPSVTTFKKGEKDWEIVVDLSKDLEVFPVVYTYLKEPVWGGDAGTILVEALEEMESYQGMYIKRNALPTFTIDYGDDEDGEASTIEEKTDDTRRVILLGKGGKMDDVTWEGADAATTSRYGRIRNAFFEQAQIPDTSFANMITSNTSAENKELLFADSKAKAKDLGGEWERVFYQEMEMIKGFMRILFPKYAKDLDLISVRSTVQPYSIKSKKEAAEFVALASSAMSKDSQVRELGVADDVKNEVEAIEQENSAEANQF